MLSFKGNTMRIENNFTGPTKIKQRQYVSLLKSPNFDAAKTKCFTVIGRVYKLFLLCT